MRTTERPRVNAAAQMPDTDTEAGRREIIARMREAIASFYPEAALTGCHALIEFTGLMNEFVNVCTYAEDTGVDWVHANAHSVAHLPFAPHHVAYLAEKLECIYGAALLRAAVAKVNR